MTIKARRYLAITFAFLLLVIAGGVKVYYSTASFSIGVAEGSYAENGLGKYSGYCFSEVSRLKIPFGSAENIKKIILDSSDSSNKPNLKEYKSIYIVGNLAMAIFDDEAGGEAWRVEAEAHHGELRHFPVEDLGELSREQAATIIQIIENSVRE